MRDPSTIKSIKMSKSNNSRDESASEKTGYEASDIIEDALQLAVDDELKEDREDTTSENENSSKVNCQKYAEEPTCQQRTGLLSPPKPESAPVVAPLTIEDKIAMDTSKQRNTGTDDTSLIVNLDDTQNELLDGDTDSSNNPINTSDTKPNRKSINENNNCSDPKSDSNSENKDNEESNSSAKDLIKTSDKESAKSKSANQRDVKIKTKESKTAPVTQKAQVNSARNIWVSGLSQNAKACELQTLFAKHGKVVSAKIIKNAKMSGSRCFGFITMENSEQVAKCIAQLNKSELHGKIISLSRNRPQESSSKVSIVRNKTTVPKKEVKLSGKATDSKTNDNEAKSEDKKEELNKRKSEEKSTNKSVSESDSAKGFDTKFNEKRKPIRAPIRDRPIIPRRNIMPPFRRPIPFRRPFPTAFSIRGFHRGGLTRGGFRPHLPLRRPDFERTFHERERRFREDRRREEFLKVEEREERIKLEREKEKIRLERMKLEREKLEWFKAERERARLERERIEREREELKRRQQPQPVLRDSFPHRVDESRPRPPIVGSSLGKRSFDSREMRPNDTYWEERKRIQQMQRIESHIEPARQTFVDSGSSVSTRHSIPHSYDSRNDSYKRNSRFEVAMTGGRSEFDARRHESRHGIGHDRDDRKTSGPTYYRGDSRSTFTSRDRRFGPSQREDWKASHDSRRSDRYADKPLSGSSASFGSASRYGADSRNWTDRTNSYGGGSIHMSGGQQWAPSSGGRWNSAINSNESRSRGQPSLNSSVISSGSHSISDLFVSTPMSGINLNVSHSMGANSLGSGDRPYIHHNNRRF